MTRPGHVHLASCGAYAGVGTAHVFWGTVSPYALPAGSDGHTLAALVAAQFTGFLLGVLSAPRLSARIGVGRHIAIALALFAVALSAPLWGLSSPILLAASVLLGAAAGSLETQIGALALEPTRGPRAQTVLEACFGFAALLFPVLVFLLSPAISWRTPVAAAAIAMALLSVTWAYIHKVSLVHPAGERRPDPKSRRVPTAAACLLLVFAMVYAGFETNFANFLPRIVDSDREVGASVLAVSGFWFGITSGRLLTVTVVHAVVGRKALTGLAVGLTGVLVGLAQFGAGLLAALPWVVAAGVFASAMFPVALTLATRIGGIPIPIMTSYFVACASLGGAAMAVPVGFTLDTFGSYGVVLLFASAAALLVALIIAPTRLRRG
ncbi:Putative glucose/mannose:H+ symporter GlcP [Mycobacteroides abscessus subsp. bolletii]|nr:Putative glucose/mannose:H+ symporter GlcP [Mycobacteroides abscessus subsp. bolletii]